MWDRKRQIIWLAVGLLFGTFSLYPVARDDVEFTRHLIREVGVACVPGSSFYSRPELGAHQVRFCFCKKDETLEAAADRLRKLQRY